MKLKKRRKSRKMRGSHTHGRGLKKKARGSGHRGGVGMAGTGKRADQKKSLVYNLYGKDYFGKDKVQRKKIKQKLSTLNLGDIEERWNFFVKKGLAKENKETRELNLTNYKILSRGELKTKMKIYASAASASTLEKVKKSGSEIIISKTNHL